MDCPQCGAAGQARRAPSPWLIGASILVFVVGVAVTVASREPPGPRRLVLELGTFFLAFGSMSLGLYGRATYYCWRCQRPFARGTVTFAPSREASFKRLAFALGYERSNRLPCGPGEVEVVELSHARRPRLALLDTGGLKVVMNLLRSGDVPSEELAARRKEIERSLAEPFTDFAVRGNELHATITARAFEADDGELLYRLLQAANGLDLVRASHAFESSPVEVSALKATRTVLSVGGRPRCPYCFESYETTQSDLVACETCRTVLHEACWEELRRCPVLGCRGTSPERARVG